MMSKSDKPAKNLVQRIEELLEKVRSMPPGGNLDELLNGESADLARLLREEASRERQDAMDRREADFPPSAGVSSLPESQDAPARPEESTDCDTGR